jgi:hypothetical protein
MLELIKLAVEKLSSLDTDITEIEKIENQYKFNRKKTLIITLIFITYFLIICLSSYYFYNTLKEDSLNYLFVITILIFVIVFFFKKSKYFHQIAVIVFIILLPFFFTTLLQNIFFEDFNFPNFIVAIIVIMPLYLTYYAFFFMIKDKLTLRKKHNLVLILNNGEELNVTLISVTRRGDYIVEIPKDENKEILINRDEIQKIIYEKVKNDDKNQSSSQ